MNQLWNPAYIDPSIESRAITFENLTGQRGAGGTAHGGRKGAPDRQVQAGERIVLADIDGPGTVRHVWMTFPPAPPELMRSLWMEVFYDGAEEPSVSVPCLDFFGLPLGRPVAYSSSLTTAQEGRGFNSYIPMPFDRGFRLEVINGAERPINLYFQVDYTLERATAESSGFLHVAFRRQNPTVMREDFVIAEGLSGPGRFLGCNVGIRVIDSSDWYGEGEVKIFLDGDSDLPTICGTGLEDYVGSAWGLGAHAAPYSGAPLSVGPPEDQPALHPPFGNRMEWIGFYRWHLPDPIMFARDLKVTIQQIGAVFFGKGHDERWESYGRTNPVAGVGWVQPPHPAVLAWGICERVDDYCATSYVYCREAQPVPRLDLGAALADIGRRPYEAANPLEAMSAVVAPS
jgi:D-arabinan exo alpha-(1,3)/(1,5)-arabinofuranosidase (non-reducing end)